TNSLGRQIMKRLRLTVLAEADLEARAACLESRRRGYAHRFLAAFDRTARRVARAAEPTARFGSDQPKLAEMRVSIIDRFPNLLILFRVTATPVEILRIVHAAQDVEGMAERGRARR